MRGHDGGSQAARALARSLTCERCPRAGLRALRLHFGHSARQWALAQLPQDARGSRVRLCTATALVWYLRALGTPAIGGQS